MADLQWKGHSNMSQFNRQHLVPATPRAPLAMRNSWMKRGQGNNWGVEMEQAYLSLSESIGYNIRKLHYRTYKLILADALSTIEKHTADRVVTRRSRNLGERDILKKLKDLVPAVYFASDGIPSWNRAQRKEWYVEELEIVTAAGKYIKHLKDKNKNTERDGSKTSQPAVPQFNRPRTRQPIEQVSIEVFLERMEKWFNAWSSGEYKYEDWDLFGTWWEPKRSV